LLDAAIIFATVGDLVPLALKAVRKGCRVVCAGIHMSDIPSFPYRLLWEERQLVSVANLTRQDLGRLVLLTPLGTRKQLSLAAGATSEKRHLQTLSSGNQRAQCEQGTSCLKFRLPNQGPCISL
jgi:propanol-preferring alcohol dehydrogenase